jgi:cobalt-zinc-cadmium efflux system outer membrane protein
VETLVQRALASRPDVLAQQAQVEQAERSLALARRLRVPDVSLVASYGQQGVSPDYSSPPNMSFGVSAPLPLFYQQQGEIDRASATLEGERIDLERARAQVRSDVETAWAAYLAATSQLNRMESGLKASANSARALVAVQYEKGTASLVELIDAQRTFVAVNVESLQVVQGYWTAVFRLEAAIGQEQSS